MPFASFRCLLLGSPLVLAALILAGCGGARHPKRRNFAAGLHRRGSGRLGALAAAADGRRPTTPNGPESVSVAQFRLAKRFGPSLWDAAVVRAQRRRRAARRARSGRSGRPAERPGDDRRPAARTYEIDVHPRGPQARRPASRSSSTGGGVPAHVPDRGRRARRRVPTPATAADARSGSASGGARRAARRPAAAARASCPAVERGLEHVVELVREHERRAPSRVPRRELLEVGLVLARQDHALQPGALRRRAPSRARRRSGAPGR